MDTGRPASPEGWNKAFGIWFPSQQGDQAGTRLTGHNRRFRCPGQPLFPMGPIDACVVEIRKFEGPFEGDERLSDAKPKPSPGKSRVAKPGGSNGDERRPGAPRKNQGDVGRVLRSVYDTTLNENIPDDFLDLLGKLD